MSAVGPVMVQLHGSGPHWTTIVGIVVAGVVGPALGYWADWRSDRRRFRHERGLKASDDLRDRLDEVAVALDRLSDTCAEVLEHAGDPEKVAPKLWDAGVAYQHGRAAIARLGMRPHADRELIAQAQAAADGMRAATRLAGDAVRYRQANKPVAEAEAAAQVPEAMEMGYEEIRKFEMLARGAATKLLGTETTTAAEPWA